MTNAIKKAALIIELEYSPKIDAGITTVTNARITDNPPTIRKSATGEINPPRSP